MLVIRMQRTGRKGHAMFRVVVQDSRRTPTSGKIVAHLGSYDPHAKSVMLDKDKAQHFLDHGAQPSDRVARLLKSEGVKLPKWVSLADKKTGKLRNPEKLRRNRPAEPVAEVEEAPQAPAEEPAEKDVASTQEASETSPETPETNDTASEEAPATEEAPTEAEPAEEPASEPALAEPEAPSEPEKSA